MPKFSIIVPVYNTSRFLRECLESVFLQECKSDFEVIIVDDGSTDNSPSIVDEYKDKAVVIHQQNQGLSAARNAGLDIAQGQWIMFVDSDDKIVPGAIAKLDEVLDEKFDSDLLAYNIRRITYDGKQGEKLIFAVENEIIKFANEESIFKYLSGDFAKYYKGWEAWGRLYKRTLIEEYNIRFVDTKKILAEDLLFTMEYIYRTKKLASICDIIYLYRINDNSLISSLDENTIIPRLSNLLMEFYNFIDNGYVKKHFEDIFFGIMNFHIQHKVDSLSDEELGAQLDQIAKENAVINKFMQKMKKKINKNRGAFAILLFKRQWI